MVLALALSLSARAAAAGSVIVVLPLDVSHAESKLTPGAQAAIEEMLRDVAVEHVGKTSWTVLTGETTLQVLRDNGVDATNCTDQSCHLSMAREIKAQRFISGSVQFSDEEFTASIRLIDTETGRILASTRLEGATPKALRKEFEAKADSFFTQAETGGAAPPMPPVAAAPVPAPAPEPTPAPSPVPDRNRSFAIRGNLISPAGILGAEFEWRAGWVGVAANIGPFTGAAVTVGMPGMKAGFFGSAGVNFDAWNTILRSGASISIIPSVVGGYDFHPIPSVSIAVGVGVAGYIFRDVGFVTVLPWGRLGVGYVW